MKNPWLQWGVFRGIANHAHECGRMCSLRFTWRRPRKSASSELVFTENSFLCFLHLAEKLAQAPLKTLHAVKSAEANILFALAEFENQITAEFEMNEALPDTMPDVFFIKANFSGGHLTNQPLGGHFNEEGCVLADQETLKLFTLDSFDPDISGNIYENIMKNFELNDAPGIEDAELLLAAIRKAVN